MRRASWSGHDCAADGCRRRATHGGYCRTHSDRVKRFGNPLGQIPIGDLIVRRGQVQQRSATSMAALSMADFLAVLAPTPEPSNICPVCQRRYQTPVAHLVAAPSDGTCSTCCHVTLRARLARETAASDARFVRTVGAAGVPERVTLMGGDGYGR